MPLVVKCGLVRAWFEFMDRTNLDAPKRSPRDLGSEADGRIEVVCFDS
jgi:hypothetical protein